MLVLAVGLGCDVRDVVGQVDGTVRESLSYAAVLVIFLGACLRHRRDRPCGRQAGRKVSGDEGSIDRD